MLMLVITFTSCQKEYDITSANEAETPSDIISQYPAEITVDNWEMFVHAPDEVLQYHHEKEMAEMSQTQDIPNISSIGKSIVSGPFSGWVKDADASGLAGVEVSTSGTNSSGNPCGGSINTNFLGNYTLNDDCIGPTLCMDWSAAPNTTNVMTGSDIVRTQQHILLIQPFTHIGQYLAADVNGSGTVTTFDLVQMQKRILGLINEFPNNVDDVIYVESDFYEYGLNSLPYLSTITNPGECYLSSARWRYAIVKGDVNRTFAF